MILSPRRGMIAAAALVPMLAGICLWFTVAAARDAWKVSHEPPHRFEFMRSPEAAQGDAVLLGVIWLALHLTQWGLRRHVQRRDDVLRMSRGGWLVLFSASYSVGLILCMISL